MRYGVCIGLDNPQNVKIVKNAGFDYIECGFALLSRAEEDMFVKFKQALTENDIKCEAANGFFPGEYPIIGHNYACKEYTYYIEKGLQRGREIGIKYVVFGSGWARSVPNDISYAEGFRQLADFLGNVVSPIADKNDISVVIEPLRKEECNIINTVKEGTDLAVCSGKGNIGCLADLYHMVNDDNDDIRQLKGSILHAHFSNPVEHDGMKRVFPKSLDEYDYQAFIDALEFAGCERCSVEAMSKDFQTDTAATGCLIKLLKQKN